MAPGKARRRRSWNSHRIRRLHGGGTCRVGRMSQIHFVDANPAQIALCRLKLHLLQTESPDARAELLGHAPLAADRRAHRLAEMFGALGLAPDVLGPLERVAELGPDHAGRYELLFARLRKEIREYDGELHALLLNREPVDGRCPVAADTPLGRCLDEALERVMALPNLIRLFGTEATQNSREPFSHHFARRIRHALATLPASDNPYLWQMLLGRFPQGISYPWINARCPTPMPRVTFAIGPFNASLVEARDCFDFVHLSNILDWLNPQQATKTLELAGQALRRGGYLLIRQLNSTLDIPSMGRQFSWLEDEAAALHARDRSFFYRSLHLGRKR